MEQQLISRTFELTHRLIGMVKSIAAKTQLNESWVLAVLVEAGLQRADTGNEGSGCIFCIVSERERKDNLASYGVCVSKELEEKIRQIARIANLNTYDGSLDIDEAAARLLILALTDRNCEFKEYVDEEDVDRLYLANPELGVKPTK